MSLKRKAEEKDASEDDGLQKRNKVSIDDIINQAEMMIVRNYPENVFLQKTSELRKMVLGNDTTVLLLEAKFYLARGHNREVKRCIDACYKINPSDFNTREFTCRWRLKKSDTEPDPKLKNDNLRWTMAECVSILKKYPEKTSILYLKGLTHHQLAQYQQAIIEFEKCFLDKYYGLKSVWQAYHSLMCMIRLKLKTNDDKKKSFLRALNYLQKVLSISETEADKTMVKENQEWINRKLESMEPKMKEKEVLQEKPKEKEFSYDKPKEKEVLQEKTKEKEFSYDKPKEKEFTRKTERKRVFV
jgi:tetratricopeptide (TPR) repeat protein